MLDGPIDAATLTRFMSPKTVLAGADYEASGMVKHVAISGDIVEGATTGSYGERYRQKIRLTRIAGRLMISGTCTCPVGHNCKHVAAVLFAAKGQAAQEGLPTTPPPELEAWLRKIAKQGGPESEDYPPGIRKRLHYVLTPHQITLASVDVRNDGALSWAGTSPSAQALAVLTAPPKYLRPSDIDIVQALGGSTLSNRDTPATLRRIVETGRGRWDAWDGVPLRLGGKRRGELGWQTAKDGRQRMSLTVEQGAVALETSPPWYVLPETGEIGPVETGVPDRLVTSLLSGPWISPALAGWTAERLHQAAPSHPVPMPAAIGRAERFAGGPRPVLTLNSAVLPFDPEKLNERYVRYSRGHDAAVASLAWRYGPLTVAPGDSWRTMLCEGGTLEVVRDSKAERVTEERLDELGLRPAVKYYQGWPRLPDAMRVHLQGRRGWMRLMLDTVPQLRAEGWEVVVGPTFPFDVVAAPETMFADIRETSGTDWFEFELGVELDGNRVDLVPALARTIASGALNEGGHIMVDLPDGRRMAVPYARIEPILQPLLSLFLARGGGNGPLKVSRGDAAALSSLEEASGGAGVAWSGAEAVRALGRQLRDQDGIAPATIPADFAATLRPYQHQGVSWLQFLRAAGLGGILADDMGLGKTVQALAHLAVEQAEGRLDRPALVICPTSLVGNWQSEAARFARRLRTLVLHGKDRAGSFDAIESHDLVITTYPLLSRDKDRLAAQEWHVVILDEAQTIKNPLATTSKLARTLSARQRLCLSGTPLENHLGELWSLFDFLMPGFLGESRAFGRVYRTPIEKGGDTERQAALARRVAPFLMRRTKEQVAPELPPKTEIIETVALGTAQRDTYEAIRLAMHTRVQQAIAERGLAQSGIVILDALLKLRQACCDPRLLKVPGLRKVGASAKLERLMELLPTLLEEGRRVLLFSQFTSMLALIEAELDAARIGYVLLTGDTKDRRTPIAQFQSGEAPLFLISLKAGGVGLNLTAADTVIHYDPWWNPAVENQATDRAHRIGQDKPVFVHRLITEGTVEQKMEALKARKQALAAGVLGDAAEKALTLTEADLEVLFAPAA